MKNYKVGAIGLLDMLKFANLQKTRNKVIKKTPAKEIDATYPINIKAKQLHPDFQELEIKEVIDHCDANAKSYILKGKPAYFRAGQYLSVKMQIKDSFITRPYSISSSPKDTEKGIYRITVKANPTGIAANHILSTWKAGDKVITSAPTGAFYYEDLRDHKNVIALAGGSGITPFISMAKAIAEGTEDFNLTLLYGCNTEGEILFKDELDEYAKKTDKFNVVYVLAGEEKEGYEQGFITAELIKKYMSSKCSIFICGPEAMYNFLDSQLDKLWMDRKDVRRELLGASKRVYEDNEFPANAKDKTFSITIKQGPREYKFEAKSNEPLLVAIERAGIKAPSKCRSGECGWCRSRLVKGKVYIQPNIEGRRRADIKANYIHPCISFPISDTELEIPCEYF